VSSPLSILLIAEGAETIAIGFLLPIISQQWHLTILQESIGLTLMNLGMPLGTLIQGYSDKYGRAPFIFLDAVVLFIFGLISAVAWDFPSFVVARFFYEIGIGICLPLTACYTAEISPA
jgi:MFS family permease